MEEKSADAVHVGARSKFKKDVWNTIDT